MDESSNECVDCDCFDNKVDNCRRRYLQVRRRRALATR